MSRPESKEEQERQLRDFASTNTYVKPIDFTKKYGWTPDASALKKLRIALYKARPDHLSSRDSNAEVIKAIAKHPNESSREIMARVGYYVPETQFWKCGLVAKSKTTKIPEKMAEPTKKKTTKLTRHRNRTPIYSTLFKSTTLPREAIPELQELCNKLESQNGIELSLKVYSKPYSVELHQHTSFGE